MVLRVTVPDQAGGWRVRRDDQYNGKVTRFKHMRLPSSVPNQAGACAGTTSTTAT